MEEAIIILLLLSRFFFVPFVKKDFDSYGHTYLALEASRQAISPWGEVFTKFWNSGHYKLPYLWHVIIGRMISPNNEKFERLINPFLDVIFAIILFKALEFWFGVYEYALLALCLYLLSPITFSTISIGTRVYSLTPRLLSEVLFNLYLLVFLFFYDAFPLIASFLIVTIFSMLLLTSKFATQVILFMVPLHGLLSNKIDQILLLCLSLLLTTLLTRGAIITTIQRQILHLWEYYQNSLSRKSNIRDRNKFQRIYRSDMGKLLSAKEIIWNIVASNSYSALALKFPVYFYCIIGCGFFIFENPMNISDQVWYVLTGLIIFLTINTPRLLFLGEAERYITHSIVACLVVAIEFSAVVDGRYILFGLILYGSAFFFLELFTLIIMSKRNKRYPADIEITEKLKELKDPHIVLSFPYHNYCAYRVVYETQHLSILPLHMERASRLKFVSNYEIQHPYVNLKKIDAINEETGVNVVIIDNSAAIKVEPTFDGLGRKWKKIELSSQIYSMYISKTEDVDEEFGQ